MLCFQYLEIKLFRKISSLFLRAYSIFLDIPHLFLILTSGFYDKNWYLTNNLDVAQAKANPLRHYLHYGGFEGRDPSPRLSSAFYIDSYADVKSAHINPLVHYLMYGKAEGRSPQPRYKCPVCSTRNNSFLPISTFYQENRNKYGYPYTFDDQETINPSQYVRPTCRAADRERLYALYIKKMLEQISFENRLALLDIAPSQPLKKFLLESPDIKYQSADKYLDGVDFIVDITDMREVLSESYDMFICSHVLEHVADDRKALSELLRILKPGGFGILMVPIVLKLEQIDEDPTIMDAETRWKRFGQFDHVRLYSKKEFIERVQEAGFIVNQYGMDYFGADVFEECGISTKSILYIVEKSIP